MMDIRMKKTYDLIASLGGDCSAACQLMNRGQRLEAYPFDWTYMESDKAVKYLIDGFANGFADFALRQNLQIMHDIKLPGTARFLFRDIHTGYCFIHHFNERVDLDERAYERAIEPLRRRRNRFLSRLNEAKDIFFILAVRVPINPQSVVDLMCSLRRMYPDKNFDFHVKE